MGPSWNVGCFSDLVNLDKVEGDATDTVDDTGADTDASDPKADSKPNAEPTAEA